MKRKDLIEKAARYLRGKGYLIGRVSPLRGIDLLVFGEDKNKPIFVTVGDATKVRSIPLNGFGYSKRAKEKAARFLQAIKAWMSAHCLDNRFGMDAVWVDEMSFSHALDIAI